MNDWKDNLLETVPSTRDEQDLYSSGMCHVLALEMLKHNPELSLLVVLSKDSTYVCDDEECPSVLHVYAKDVDDKVYDIYGVRHISNVLQECEERFNECPYFSWRTTPEELHEQISFFDESGDYHDHPLSEIMPSDVEETQKVVQKLFKGIGVAKTAPSPISP